jgi:FtsH-binding integral membrane protein
VSNVFAQFGAGLTAFDAPVDARLAFIRRTYLHLAGAIGVFVALSAALYSVGLGEIIARWAWSGRGGAWLLVLGAFALVGWLGQSMAHGARSSGTQYAGLAVYTVAEAIIFSPLIWLASYTAAERGLPSPLAPAAAITLVTFAGLSAIVLMSKRDFSFLGMFLKIGGFVAIGLIVCGVIFGFNLGLWFSGAMILFACGAILYTTSRVLHQYRTDQHVGAALELFAAVALLFWYVLRLLMQLNRRN